MDTYYYQCKKCTTLIQSEKQPNTSYCPKEGLYQWTKLGAVGNINYQCRKCGTLVTTDKQPSTSYCPADSSHQWTKL